MLLDLDHFKLVNDASGHSAGDIPLKEVANRLNSCVRETDTVARLGGDEFVIIPLNLPQPDDVDQIAEKILSALSRPGEVAGRDIFVTASIMSPCTHAMGTTARYCCATPTWPCMV